MATLLRPDIWGDCRYIKDVRILQVVDQEVATCEADRLAGRPTQRAARIELGAGPRLELAYSGSMETWVENLRGLLATTQYSDVRVRLWMA